MQKLGSLLGKQNFSQNFNTGLLSSTLVAFAEQALAQLFGNEIKKFAEVKYYKNKAININCRSSSTSQQIKLSEEEILKIINDKVGKTVVQKLNIHSIKEPS